MNETIKEFNYEIYNDRYKYGYNWQIYLNLAKKLIEIMQFSDTRRKKLIDVGCGMGWFSDILYFNISKDIKAIDFSNIAVNFHAKRLYPQVDFEVANIYEYDYKGYEIAILMEVLEHLEKDIELLSKFDTGTQIFFTVPFENTRQDCTHVREYTHKMIDERFKDILDIKCNVRYENFIIVRGIKK